MNLKDISAKLIKANGHLLVYGISMAVLLFVLKWLQWKFIITDNASDIYIGLIAIVFTVLGVWIARQFVKPRVETVIVEKEVYINPPAEFQLDESELKKLNLTAREQEVLLLISKGLSNAEIADTLFLSLSTIKTHASNIFVKLDVKSRTQAIAKSKSLRINS